MNDRSIFTSFTGAQNDGVSFNKKWRTKTSAGSGRSPKDAPPNSAQRRLKAGLYLKRIKLWVTWIADVFLVKQGVVLPILSSAQGI